MTRSLAISYAVLTPVIGAFFYALYSVVARGAGVAAPSTELIAPITALAGLTFVVALIMVVVRNGSVVRGLASIAYYASYRSADAPSEWIERPARTFANLLELPVLFYVVCILMLVTQRCDAAQVQLAWIFVAARALHAAIYIGINHVPARFGAYLMGFATLTVMWFRFGS